MILLLSYQPYAGKGGTAEVIRALRERGYKVKLLREWHLRALIETNGRAIYLLNKMSHVSRIVIVHAVLESRDPETLKGVARKVLESLCERYRSFKVEVRRWDKTYPLTSMELARTIGRELASLGMLEPDLENPELTLFIGIDKDSAIVGYTTHDLVKKTKAMPSEISDSFVAIVDRPRMLYEIMDLVQLSRALNIEIRILGDKRAFKLLSRALKILELKEEDTRVSLIPWEGRERAFKDLESVVVLTPYAEMNEEELVKFVKRAQGKVGLLLGNEFEDVSLELRKYATLEVRLGPRALQPMRTAIALAYVLGLLYSLKAGYVS